MNTVLIHEEDIGIDKMVDDLEEAYKRSCKHNDTDENDLSYLRRYMFSIISLQLLKIQEIEKP
ncbi:MAG: hypothetical protein ABUK08_00355 [Candidatus Humimicrobiaceae bacterium]